MRKWLSRVREHVPAAAHHDDQHVLNSLPKFIDDLVEVLKNGDPAAVTATDVSREHARQRAELPGYTLGQNVLEYRLLRKTIFESLEEDAPVPARERDLLHEALDYAIGEAGAEFMRQHTSRSTQHIEELEQERILRELFVSTLSHDLRQPLTVARLNSQLAMRRAGEDAQSRALSEKVVSSLGRVGTMIRHLLDANRIRAGQRLPLEIGAANFSVIVGSVLDELTATYGDRFKFHHDGAVQGFWSSDHLRRVVENLVENAVKYGEPASEITIALEQSGDRTFLRVHNRGPPIPEHEQEHIFDQFHRAASTATSNMKGWGLGLSFVRAAAEAHGGRVSVESSLEQGTTFVVELPTDALKASRTPTT